jgi:hypothetical protein
MTAPAGHLLFEAALDPDTRPHPWWMAREEAGLGWHIQESGEFPHVQDKALIEEEKPDG